MIKVIQNYINIQTLKRVKTAAIAPNLL